ncbi:helix-turn-helix domain-containing protein [Ponticoccus alexandrii]|uniref:LysR family transcriptional regulator n=1 Tax=Ponticoccus alexandrii TaxID=1943633 RepID=A0ABX7FBU3_9RHOB|nr:LysR family transcriptional regulator [Ponticoccus alexandrii]QRF67586.1 LysR family transcriptional regulator [Ponticoccus alexandrii]
MTRAALNGSRADEILTFLAIVETGSFVSGSRSMGLSRSAAGKALSRLEVHGGARLLNGPLAP